MTGQRPPIADPFARPLRAPGTPAQRGVYGCPACGLPVHGNAKQTPDHGVYRMRGGRPTETDEPCLGAGEKPTKT